MPAKTVIRPLLYRLGKRGRFFATKQEAVRHWHQSTGLYKSSAPIVRLEFKDRSDLCEFFNAEMQEEKDANRDNKVQ